MDRSLIIKERKLKRELLVAMLAITEYWDENEDDTLLGVGYPFQHSFDDITAKVREWSQIVHAGPKSTYTHEQLKAVQQELQKLYTALEGIDSNMTSSVMAITETLNIEITV